MNEKIEPGQLRVWRTDIYDPDHVICCYFLLMHKREHEHEEDGWYILEEGRVDWEWAKIIVNYSEVVGERT